jgi:polyhydroxyalkanoate synthesis regulator phasin
MDAPADPQSSASLRGVTRDVLLAGLGAAAITREKADELAEELVRRGKLTREEAREVADELVAGKKGEGKRLAERAGVALAGLFHELGLATERRYEELELRVAQLEHRLRLVEKEREREEPSPPTSEAETTDP